MAWRSSWGESKRPHPIISLPPSLRCYQLASTGPTVRGHTALTMMATLENSIAERNCQTLGEVPRGQL